MTRRPVKSNKTATISVFSELPGAMFVGTPSNEDMEIAIRMQAIRQDYEQTDCQATLWHELTQMGCGYDEIEAAILNPATLTNCAYVQPGTSLAGMSALVSVAA